MNTAPPHPSAASLPLPGGNTPVRLPPVRVRAEPSEIAAFSLATGGAGSARFVPLTFPFCWFALPSVRGFIVHAVGDGFLPLHEAQSFAYRRALQPGSEYILAVEARRSTNPDRLTLEARVLTPRQEICVELETVLRIVPVTTAAAAS